MLAIDQHLGAGGIAVKPESSKRARRSSPRPAAPSKIASRRFSSPRSPASRKDGGDITLDKYENGVVYLHMQGSCSAALVDRDAEDGIETRLKESIPEVTEVVAV